MMMSIHNLVLFCQLVLKKKQILTSIKGCNSVANLQKTQRFTILMLILSMIMCIQNLVSICLFVLKILSKNQILTSIKGRNSIANLRKTMIYITDADLVNDYMYTNFGLNRSIFLFKILSKNSILMLIKGRNSIANLPKFELIQALMHVLVTCKNEEDQIENDSARLSTRFLPL